MYLLESNWEDLNMIRINKKLKERSYMSTSKKNLWSLVNMRQRATEKGDPLSSSSVSTTRSTNMNSKDTLTELRNQNTDLTTSQIEIDLN